jgi:hypothetical protein
VQVADLRDGKSLQGCGQVGDGNVDLDQPRPAGNEKSEEHREQGQTNGPTRRGCGQRRRFWTREYEMRAQQKHIAHQGDDE